MCSTGSLEVNAMADMFTSFACYCTYFQFLAVHIVYDDF